MASDTQRLWYVRLAGQIRGPFPTAAVAQDLALGRLAPDTLLSTDRANWAPAGSLEAFRPVLRQGEPDTWAEERRQALRRWADERTGEPAEGSVPGTRIPGERRGRGGNLRSFANRASLLQIAQTRAWVVVAVLTAVVVLVLTLALFLGADSTPEIRLLK